jgi:hypothetical protein
MFMGAISFRPGSGLVVAGPAGWLYVVAPIDGPTLDNLIAVVLSRPLDVVGAVVGCLGDNRGAVGEGFVVVEPIASSTSMPLIDNDAPSSDELETPDVTVARGPRVSARLLLHGRVAVAVDHGDVQELIEGTDEAADPSQVDDVASVVVDAGGSRLYRLVSGSIAPADGFTYRAEAITDPVTTHLINEEPAWFWIDGPTDLETPDAEAISPEAGSEEPVAPEPVAPLVEQNGSPLVESVPVAAAASSWLTTDIAGPAPSPWAPEPEPDPAPARAIHSIYDAPAWAKEPLPVVVPVGEPVMVEADREPVAAPDVAPAAAIPPTPTGVTVNGRYCPSSHFNAPLAATCSQCGDDIEPLAPVVSGVRPSLGRLLLDDGDAIDLLQPVVLGRFPSPKLLVDGEVPRQVRLVDAEKRVSQQHLIIRLVGWDVVAEDQRSTNGTSVRGTDSGDTALEPGGTIVLTDRMVVTMAKRRSFRFVGPRPTGPALTGVAASSNA